MISQQQSNKQSQSYQLEKMETKNPEEVQFQTSTFKILNQEFTTQESKQNQNVSRIIYKNESPVKYVQGQQQYIQLIPAQQYAVQSLPIQYVQLVQQPMQQIQYVQPSQLVQSYVVEQQPMVEREVEQNTQELQLLQSRIQELEQQNMVLKTKEPQVVEKEKIVYIENNEKLVQLQSELSELQNNNETIKRSKKTEVQNFSDQISEYESKIETLLVQVQNLSNIIIQKEEENKQMTEQSILEEQQKLQISQQYESELTSLKNLLVIKQQEIEQLQTAISQLRIYEDKLVECEGNNALLRNKIQELMVQIDEQASENVKRSSKTVQLESQVKDVSLLEEKLVQMTQLNELSAQKILAYENEINTYRSQIVLLEGNSKQIQIYEDKIVDLQQSQLSLITVLSQKESEISEMNIKISSFQLSSVEVSRLNELILIRQTEMDLLKKRNVELESSLINLKLYQDKLIECELNNQQLRQRLDQVSIQLISKNEEIKRQSNKVIMISQSTEYLSLQSQYNELLSKYKNQSIYLESLLRKEDTQYVASNIQQKTYITTTIVDAEVEAMKRSAKLIQSPSNQIRTLQDSKSNSVSISRQSIV